MSQAEIRLRGRLATDCGVIRLFSRAGVPYRLRCEHVIDYAALPDDPGFCWLHLRFLAAPVQVVGSVALMDRAFAAAAVCHLGSVP